MPCTATIRAVARSHKLDIVRTIRINAETDHRAKTAGKRWQVTDAVALRFAAEVGFEVLRLIDYDVPHSIANEAIRRLAEKKAGK